MTSTGASAAGEIQVDVAIVGAGPAGLTAGYLLSQHGKSVAIIEKDTDHVGGARRTVEHQGIRFDLGGHRPSPGSQAVADLCNEILPGEGAPDPGAGRVYYEGKLYSYPPRPLEALRNLGLLRAGLCAASYLSARLSPIKEVGSLEDWGRNRFGRRLYSTFFKAYAEKVWGQPCTALRADWAADRFKGAGLRSLVNGGLTRPVGLWNAARDRIVERGGQVLMGHSLKQLASDGQGGWRMTAARPGGEVVIRAAFAISSAPMRELAARLYPLPVSTIEASQLRYRDLLTVALVVEADGAFAEGWTYIHDNRVEASRMQAFRSRSDGAGPSCVTLEYFCSDGDSLWSMHDDKLLEQAARELGILGLAARSNVIGGTVVRQEKAYPVNDQACAANVAAMRAELEANYPTLHLVGRKGMHRNDSQDHAVMSAILTVENILAGHTIHDAWGVSDEAALASTGNLQPVRETGLVGRPEAPSQLAGGDRKAA